MSNSQGRDKSPEAEHLGWRATSSMPSKKRKFIEGVSGKGVVELQAQLYRTQEQARMRGDGLPGVQDKHIRRKAGIDVSSIKNKGVEAREAHDRAAAAKATGTGPERLAESAAALQRKAELYERLAAQGGAGDEEQDDKYEVEFWRKGAAHDEEQWQQQRHEQEWLQGEGRDPHDSAHAAVGGSGDMMTDDMARERERREWEAREEARLAAEAEEAARRAAHKAAIKELSAQTQAGRDEAAVSRAAKDDAVAAKRAQLKAAFISQQVKAIKAKQQQQQSKAAGGSSRKAAGTGSRQSATTSSSIPGSNPQGGSKS